MARQLTLEIAVEKARAEANLRDLERGLKNLEQAALKTGQATDKQVVAHENLSRRAAAAKDQISKLTAEQKSAVTVTEAQTKATGLLSSAVLRYVSAAAVISAVKLTADWADRLEELHHVTGLSITVLQKLDTVTKQNGSSIEAITRAFSTLQDRVAGGDKSAVRAFERLGLSFSAFQRLRPDDQLEAVAVAVMRIEDPMERANVVTDLFGKTGVQLIPTLQKIAEGMDDVTVASEANVKAVGRLSDYWAMIVSLGYTLATESLGPVIRQLELMADNTANLTDRTMTFYTFLAQRLRPELGYMLQAIQSLSAETRSWLAVLPGGKGVGTPHLPNAPEMPWGLDGVPLPGGGDPDAFIKLTNGYADVANAQIASVKASASLAKEAAKDAAEASERSAQAWAASMASQAQTLSAAALYMANLNGSRLVNGQWTDPLSTFGMINQHSSINWTNSLPGNIGQGYAPGAMPVVTGTDMSWYHNPQRPGFWSRQMQTLSGQQAAWRQQNFGSVDGWVNSAYGWGSALNDVVEHGDPLVNATNVKGRGNRALKGALKGAEVGGQFGGPYGAMGGAAVGLIMGLVRNPAFEQVFKGVQRSMGGLEISDDLAKQIADLAKTEYHGSHEAATIRSLGSIIGEGGGLKAGNVGVMTARLHDAFTMFGTGKFGKNDLRDTLDDSFGLFADYYNKIGGLADQNFRRIIEMSREAGVESAAVTQYVSQQVTVAASGLEQYLTNATVKSESAAAGLAAASVLLFDEIRNGPEGLRGAIEQVGPVISALQAQMEAAGYSGSEAFASVLADVQAFQVEGVAQAADAVEGLDATLVGLYNATLLNAEAFTGLSRAMTDEIEAARQALIAQGKDGDAALRLNADGLQTVWELQKQFGWAVDESTQKMLDEAEAAGLIGAKFMDTNKQLLDTMERVATALETMVDGFGFVGDAAADAGRAIDDAITRPRTVPVEFEFPDGTVPDPWNEDTPNPNTYARGGIVLPWRPRYAANGFWAPRGTDTVPAMLTPGEGVLTRRGVAALGALNAGGTVGGGVTIAKGAIVIHANSRSEGLRASEGVMEGLRRAGVKLTA